MSADNAELPPLSLGQREAAPRRRSRGKLFRKYVLFFVGLVAVALIINGGFDFWFGYQENKAALIHMQQQKADAAAQRIEEFVEEIERQIGWTTHAQWSAAPLDQRRFDYVRLLSQVPAITEISELDKDGKEQLKVSRLAMDVVGSQQDLSQTPAFIEARKHKVWFSPVYFRKESEPYMTLAMARAGRNAGVTVAEVNLKLIWDVITAMRMGQGGYAFVVDGHGKLIAHPDISLVLRDTDFSHLPQVAMALPMAQGLGGPPMVSVSHNAAGRAVLSAHATIAPLGWLVFVEVPLSEAFAPLYGAALRSLALLAFGLIGALLAALVLARKMTVPIREMQEGAAQIGAGDLNRRLDIRTGDELEALAQQFNHMAADLQTSYAELEHKVEERTAELSEALDQQTATAEVLGVINSSPGNLGPVLDTLAKTMARLCDAEMAFILRRDGDLYRAAAATGWSPEYRAFLETHPIEPNRGTVTGRVVLERRAVHVVDIASDPEYVLTQATTLGNARTQLGVPLLREDMPIGVIILSRQRVEPFTDKQVQLVVSFAAQAAIAFENARLMTETNEALDQQTATAEVLGVINASPGNLSPVFAAILERAMTRCEAAFGFMTTYDGEQFVPCALHDVPEALASYFATGMDQPQPGDAHWQLLQGAGLVHNVDQKDDEAYRSGSPLRRAVVDLGGTRTALVVALRKDGVLRGTLTLYRQEVRPFSEKQIALVQNFAAQAVIAMENARLITETQEALDQQTATAEILRIISNSTMDIRPVFDAIVERATTLCEAEFAGVARYQEGKLYLVATNNLLVEEAAAFHALFPREPSRGYVMGRAFLQCSPVLVEDVLADPDYDRQTQHDLLSVTRYRTFLGVPIIQDGQAIGVIGCARREIRPFTAGQIELVATFADQAVIAIENVRLLTETQEALDQQTATAEVLGVINSSPGDLGPVLDAMLEKAVRLCEGSQGIFWTYDGDLFSAAAFLGVNPAFAAALCEPVRLPAESPLGRVVHGEPFVQVLDMADTAVYRDGFPLVRAVVDLGNVRSLVVVPLIKDGTAVGIFAVARGEVHAFTDKQIALLQNFAAQAVIAMENARLITETREALDQQTATAEVLGVINASPGDLAPVFDAMLEKALRLCDAVLGTLWTYDGERMHPAAIHGASPEYSKYLSREPLRPGGGALGGFVRGENLLSVADLRDTDAYRSGDAHRRALVDLGGGRSLLGVALRADDQLLGAFLIYRREPQPFTEKQVALLQNFAAQAVIAIQNARLLDEIRQRQAELRVTFDNMADGVVMFDEALRLAAWNRNFQELVGLPDAFFAEPRNFSDFIHYLIEHGEFGDTNFDREYARLQERFDEQYSFERTRPDGQILEVRHNPMPEGGFVLIYSDVTERKRSEAEIRAARDDAQAALRDLKAAQGRLIQAEKMASLGQLTAGIAHEIKNPLNFVNNFAALSNELLAELKEVAAPAIDALDEDKREELDEVVGMLSGNLEKIAEHGRRADNIVKSMLEHSRGVSGERREVDLNGLVEEALNLAYHGARAQDQGFNITLERHFAEGLRPVELVPQDMTRVFLNLFGNGFYAANKRAQAANGSGFRPVLRVATRETEGAVEVRVRDNGTGIPAAIRDKLFQPFFTTKPTGEGTGLGLSITYDIVTQQHGGTIAVDSEEGSFTEFTIRLPRDGGGGAGSAGRMA